MVSSAKERIKPSIIPLESISIVSTSAGVMTGKQAQAQNVGGEVLCYVY